MNEKKERNALPMNSQFGVETKGIVCVKQKHEHQ